MADEKKEKKSKKEKKEKKKGESLEQLKIAYRSLEDPKKFYRTILLPLIVIGILIFFLPFILGILLYENFLIYGLDALI